MAGVTTITIPAEVAQWLGDTGSVNPTLFKRRSGSVLMIGENFTTLMQGISLSRAINATTGRNRRLDSIVTTGSGRTQRIANWEILTPILRRLGCTLDPDARKSIVSGDPRVVTRVVVQLYSLIGRSDSAADKKRTAAKVKNTSSKKVVADTGSASRKVGKMGRTAKGKSKIGSQISQAQATKSSKRVDIEPLLTAVNPQEIKGITANPNMLIASANSVPEFWCIVLCEQLHIRPEQAVALLTTDSNYLCKLCFFFGQLSVSAICCTFQVLSSSKFPR
jgi:hypothetical protein